jgi:CHRD domain-containing protein
VRINRGLRYLVLGAALVGPPALPGAQQGDTFKGVFARLPMGAADVATMTGSGSFTAVLDGDMLKITGKFEGLGSPATMAHVHRAYKGMRGPIVFDLNVTKAAAGTIDGHLKLTPAQVDELRKGWLYVQIHTAKNPDGQLRAWLLK